jgi:hypothetical protein
MVAPVPIVPRAKVTGPILLICEWKKRSALRPIPEVDFDYHICVGYRVSGTETFRHYQHRLNPKHFRSSSNDVSGTFGLLGNKENEQRIASFERAVADLVHVNASAALHASEAEEAVLFIRGPMIPKLRGRLLMSAISREIQVYSVTEDRAQLECMDLQANPEGASYEQILGDMKDGEIRGTIPPAGLDKGTRSWLARRDGALMHFELVANMHRGELTGDWLKARESEIYRCFADGALTNFAAAVKLEIEGFYGVPTANQPPLPIPKPSTRDAGGLKTTDADRVPVEARRLIFAYKPFLSRKGWGEFSAAVENEFWPAVVSANRMSRAVAVLEECRPRHLRSIDPMKNRLRVKRALKRLRDLLRYILADGDEK